MDGKNLVTKTKIRLRSRITRTSDDLDRFMSRLLLCHTPTSPDGKTPDRALLQYDRPCYVGFGTRRASHLPGDPAHQRRAG